MKRTQDWKDLTIRWDGHQKYIYGKVTENDLIEVIVQKLEMILFTKSGEIYGQLTLGANIEYYLWETKINADIIKTKVKEQITEFVHELDLIGYDIDLKILPGSIQDIMEINIKIKGYNLFFIFDK